MGMNDQSEAREPPCGGKINHPSQEPSASDGPETVRRWGYAPLANQRPELGQVTNQRPESEVTWPMWDTGYWGRVVWPQGAVTWVVSDQWNGEDEALNMNIQVSSFGDIGWLVWRNYEFKVRGTKFSYWPSLPIVSPVLFTWNIKSDRLLTPSGKQTAGPGREGCDRSLIN